MFSCIAPLLEIEELEDTPMWDGYE